MGNEENKAPMAEKIDLTPVEVDPSLSDEAEFGKPDNDSKSYGMFLKAFSIIAALLALFHLYTAQFGILTGVRQRAVHLTIVLVLTFMIKPANRKKQRTNLPPFYDFIFMLGAIVSGAYMYIMDAELSQRSGTIYTIDVVMGVILILLILEACRRLMGWALPIILLVVLLNYWSASKVGFWVIVSAIALSFTNKDTHMTPKKFYGALVDSGKGMLEVGVSCAISGIVVGVFGLTGLGLKFSNVLVTLAGGNLFALLIMTAIASIILGMGMSTLPVYLILATLVAPALTKMGIPPIAAHLFIFYYGIIAAITPPVAIAAYAGASIAKEDPIKVGLTACRLGVGAYILPFMFAFGPALVLQGTPLEIAQSIVTAIVGISCLGMAIEGYIYKIGNVNVVSRVLLIAGALCLTIPGTVTDLVGLALVVVTVALSIFMNKTAKAKAA